MAPYFLLAWLMGAFAVVTWLLSVLTREYSWVDRIWSIAPAVYAILMAYSMGFSVGRLNLVALLVTLWGARLTFNYWRKGGYAPGGEDYRWAVLRERLGPVGFQIFNATFISPYQNLLVFLMVAPMHVMQQTPAPLNFIDAILAGVFLLLLAGEFVADQQQWNFYESRNAAREKGNAHPNFLTSGLFRFSRHPNFFCEVSQWWVVYFFAISATGTPLTWTVLGVVLLTLLFHGSTQFTEAITLSKYPDYVEYQSTTSRVIPLPSRA